MLGGVIPALLAVAMLATCAALSRAHSGATGAALTGLVVDQTDARLPAANLTVTNTGTNVPTFGQFQTAGPPRQAQLAVKVTF